MKLTFAIIAAFLGQNADRTDPAALRVMSYNIRYGTAEDGINHWDRRKDFLVGTIRAFDPDVLGTQETLGFQRDYLAKQLTDHEGFGVGRDDGKDGGEMMAVYWRKGRFTKLAGGHFWLSPTPEQPGSKGWDTVFPRMATWVKLEDRLNLKAPPILLLNTHFDHRGQQARLESARLLRQQIAKLGKGCSIVLTGDFNSGEGSGPYKALFDPLDDAPSIVVDSYRVLHRERQADEGTATGFLAVNTKGSRIDWIACSRDWQVTAAAIDRTEREGRTPSDHFAVTAILRR
jgi:endonuclease/exonuclease/phosphatase family metal-dependent hydrolase